MNQLQQPSSRANAIASWIALVLAIAYFSYRGPIIASGGRLWDYAVYASSAYEWAQGREAYYQPTVNLSWKLRQPGFGIETSLARWQAIAPPWTLAMLVPFAVLPIVVGAYAYLAVAMVLNAIAAWTCARWAALESGATCRWFASALLISVPMKLGLASGNPVVMAAPLLLIGLYVSRNGRWCLGGLLLGLGTAYKFQLGLPLVAFWLVYGKWRASSVAVGVFALAAAVGIARPHFEHLDVWHAWLENVAAANGPGGVNDFTTTSNPDDHLNLQVPLWWLTHDRAFANVGAIVLWFFPAIAFAAWLWRDRGTKKHERATIAAIGVTALLCVLPIYHRAYDGLIFVPIVALAVVMVRRSPLLSLAMVMLLAPLCVPSGLPGLLERRGYLPPWMTSSLLFRGLVVPEKAWGTFMLAILLVAALWQNAFGSAADEDSLVIRSEA